MVTKRKLAGYVCDAGMLAMVGIGYLMERHVLPDLIGVAIASLVVGATMFIAFRLARAANATERSEPPSFGS